MKAALLRTALIGLACIFLPQRRKGAKFFNLKDLKWFFLASLRLWNYRMVRPCPKSTFCIGFLCAPSVFSVSLWWFISSKDHHRDTEDTEKAQRRGHNLLSGKAAWSNESYEN